VLDAANFAGKDALPRDLVDDPWYYVPSLGDVVTVLFGVGLVHECKKRRSLPTDDPMVKSLAKSIWWPQASAFRWLKQWGLDPRLRQDLDQILVTLLDRFLADEFVKWQLHLSPAEDWAELGSWQAS
jgi:hypothetical protein